MKVGLITTLDTNIGDDFIRMGIQRVLRSLSLGEEPRWEMVNKHQSETAWPVWHPCRHLPEWAPNWRRTARRLGRSRFHGCNLIVQCGAPVLWEGCARCEWNVPLWQEIIGELRGRIPVMNLAIGSAYSLSAVPERIEDEADRHYLRSILSYCCLTTARDRLAQQLVMDLGAEIPLIPCPAGLAFEAQAVAEARDIVLVNYMPKAGHYDFSRDVDEDAWDRMLREVLARVSRTFRVVFLCHDRREEQLAGLRFPQYERRHPETPEAYAALARQGVLGLFNRLHAAVAFAGMGIPSVAVGNDTRLWMVAEYGLPAFNVRECTAESIWAAFEDLARRHMEERQRLLALRETIQERYERAVSSAWRARG
jgi:hypothetical protein